jgi:hypothetical protein
MRGFRRTRLTASRSSRRRWGRLKQHRFRSSTPLSCAQIDPFELRPEALPRIQLRGIGGQAFHVHPLRRTIRQESLDRMTAVDRRPIPDNDHAAGHLTQEVFQEGHHIL